MHVYPERASLLDAIDIAPDEALDAAERRLRAVLQQGQATEETLLLADAFGASPCSVALRVVDGVHTRLVAGVNVPMLWRALCYCGEPLDALVARAVNGAAQGVMHVAVPRPQNQSPTATRDDHDPNRHQQ